MKSRNYYIKETGLSPFMNHCGLNIPTPEYIEWLEKQTTKLYKPQIVIWIETMFEHARKKEWFETYFSFDIHGTISRPDYRRDKKELNFYPYAKETLQLLTQRKDIILIMFTSSYPEEIEIYKKEFENNNINFNYINENPEVSTAKGSFGYYEKKHYFNVFFDDKCGFNPKRDWEFIYDYFIITKYRPNPNWSMKYKENYHK